MARGVFSRWTWVSRCSRWSAASPAKQRGSSASKLFEPLPPSYADNVWPMTTKVGMVTHLGKKHVSRVSVPEPNGMERHRLSFLWRPHLSTLYDTEIPNFSRQSKWEESHCTVYHAFQERHLGAVILQNECWRAVSTFPRPALSGHCRTKTHIIWSVVTVGLPSPCYSTDCPSSVYDLQRRFCVQECLAERPASLWSAHSARWLH